MGNTNLRKAKREKNDEFYTRYEDIEKELSHYKSQLADMVVYCNCDSPSSNFTQYFIDNFDELGLKKLITTCYCKDGNGIYFSYTKDGNGYVRTQTHLNGDGDFRSEECLKILKEVDIVVTNPPFSLFREIAKVLFDNGKKFLVIANQNAITYKEFFPYLKEGKVWLGKNMVKEFIEPDNTLKKFGNICWFTNLKTNKQAKALTLIKTYNPMDYSTYDNYNAINVDKVAEIPYDYDGVIGVPITILSYLCDDGLIHFNTPMRERSQYKIVGAMTTTKATEDNFGYPYINSKKIYARILIRRV